MHGSSFSRYGASLLAFGHLSGLYSASRGHGRSRRARPIVVPPAPEPAINKEDITYEAYPELWRALNPLFSGRQTEAKQAEPVSSFVAEKLDTPAQEEKPVTESLQVMTPSGNIQPATWTWQI